MLGTKWYPSHIEDEIYDTMMTYEVGFDLYNEGLTDAIADYFTNYLPEVEWQLGCSMWPNETGGVCSVSWIEDGHIHMISFDYIKEGCTNE